MKFSEVWNDEFINISLIYAREYEKDGKVFVSSFLKFNSIKWVCREIVIVYKNTGAWAECEQKDFSGWVGKLNLEDKWKKVLADVLVLIWNLTKPR